MTYKATLGGEPLATGTMQEIQQASMEAITEALGKDPEGVAMSAAQANRDFQSSTVEATVASVGEWKCPMWVHGDALTLVVTKEG
ncbi:hypothetical protein OG381_34520 [Streptomyces sp. NBC_00490]|uniref:hypothetical protein n=1 Tax=Streptomyces sp. NBC_00490 TaxID=2903657 RepID=UPI002E19D4A1